MGRLWLPPLVGSGAGDQATVSVHRDIEVAPDGAHPVAGITRFLAAVLSLVLLTTGAFVTSEARSLTGSAATQARVPRPSGNTLILNTRSAKALEMAGIPRSEWNVVKATGNMAAEARLTNQLLKNGLDSTGTPTVRMTGGG